MSKQTHIIDVALNLLPMKKAADVAGGILSGIGKVGVDALKGIGIAAAGTGVAILGLKSSLADLELGFERVIQFSATSPFRKLATDINSATSGIISMTDALELAERGRAAGLNDEISLLVGKYTAQIKLTGGARVNEIDLARKLFKSYEKGLVDEEARRYLGDKITAQLSKQLNIQNKAIRLKRFESILQKDLNSKIEASGNIMNSKMAKFLGMVKALRDESTGAFALFKGLGKAAGSILAPLGAGLSSFMVSPISGIVGTIVGGISSATVGAVAIKIVQAFTKEAKKAEGDVADSVSNIFATINALFENIGTIILEPLLKGISGETGELGKISDKAIKDIGGKDRVKKIAETANEIGRAFGAFSDNFIKYFDLTKIGNWLKSLAGFKPGDKVDLVKVGQQVGDLFGKSVSGILDVIMKITPSIDKVNETLFKIKDLFLGIQSLFNAIGEIFKTSFENPYSRFMWDVLSDVNKYTSPFEIFNSMLEKAADLGIKAKEYQEGVSNEKSAPWKTTTRLTYTEELPHTNPVPIQRTKHHPGLTEMAASMTKENIMIGNENSIANLKEIAKGIRKGNDIRLISELQR